MIEANPESKSRLLAKLTRELLAAERFTSLADLTEALKCRCARLRIAWTNDAIGDAYRLIASNRELVGDAHRLFVSPRRIEPVSQPPVLSRAEAAAFLKDKCGISWPEPAAL